MELISKAKLAERAGVSTAAVSQITKPGRRLAKALVDGKVNLSDPEVKRWLAEKEEAKPAPPPAALTAGTAYAGNAPEAPEINREEIPARLERYADMTLRQIVNHFGTFGQFETMLKALKTIEDIQEKRIKNAERLGELISREFVANHVLGLINGLASRILNESAESIARKVPDIVKAGGTHNDVRPLVLDILSSEIKSAKHKVEKRIKNAARLAQQ